MSFWLRVVYATCLIGATCVHVGVHVQYGVFLEGLVERGYSVMTRVFWSALTIADPTAAVLLFVRPRVGLVFTMLIIVSDVIHNGWLALHFGGRGDVLFWCQVAFLIFLLASVRYAWMSCGRQTTGS